MPSLVVRPEAELDTLDAAAWYDEERRGLGTDFLGELRETFAQIELGPARFPVVYRNVRRAILRRFPFGVFFVMKMEHPTVLAIMHLRRHPGAWQKRV